MKRYPLYGITLLIGLLPSLTGCRHKAVLSGSGLASVVAATAPSESSAQPCAVRFRDVGERAGLHYRWEIPGKRPLTILQTMGNGCAFLDYDNDSNLDILLVGPKLALYKGDGHGHFTDVTHETGLDRFHADFEGCAVGDYDNDGYPDLYISGYQTGLLLHNEGGRYFRDVTEKMGLKLQPWGTSCSFADIDGDGYLDLYIANYCDFGLDTDPQWCSIDGILAACGPSSYRPLKGVLYHNEAGRRFRDVTQEWGLDRHTGKGLGVAFADFDGSGRAGLYVANDLLTGNLFQNLGRGHFKNLGAGSGAVSSPTGSAQSGMGVDWGDYDNDGKLDLFVGTFAGEVKALYHNEGNGLFTYAGDRTLLENPTLPYVTFGCKFFDADNDGWLDLVVANGYTQDNVNQFKKAVSYREPIQFLHNTGGPRITFRDESRASGIAGLPPIVGRGLAVGDYDNDGRMDVLIVDSEGRPMLLHNESRTPPKGWVDFRLIGAGRSNRAAYGATVVIEAGGQKRMRLCQPGGSYLSSSDPRVHFGLGRAALQGVSVRWPDGVTQTWKGLQPGRYITLKEGFAGAMRSP